MDKKSWRHHYLPVFYFKGFTKESNTFKIYNVEEKRFIKNGKEFSPESYFFKKNANTINFKGNKTDFLETEHYSHFDNEIAKLFNKINSSDNSNKYSIDEDDMPRLNHFVSLMYWRLPHKDSELKSIIESNNLNQLGLEIKNSDGTNNIILEDEFKKNSQFLKTYKYLNSLMDSVRGYNCRTPYTIFETVSQFPFMCSDNPVLFKKSKDPKVFEDDYIFPLTGNKLFIRAKDTSELPAHLRIMVDTLIYKQAVKYVSCSDERYIEILDNNFEKKNISVEDLRIHIFDKLG